jgi:hypothetical protein
METLPDPLSGEPEEAPPEGEDRDPGPPSLGPDLEKVLAVGGRRVRPRTAPAKVEFQGNPAFRGEEAAAANREAADLVRGSLDGGLSGERALLRRIDPRRVLVCTGCYDRTEDVLGLLGVRHDVLRMEEIGAAPLGPDALLLVDCGVDRLGPESAAKVRDFVASGGYLCTTDWGLENVLVPAFPGVLEAVRRKGREVVTVEEVVPFTVSAPGHPLVRALQAAAEDGTWWLEDQSHPIRVVDRRRAVVLAESPELRDRYGSAVLAVTFEWGHGRVLHLLGHAWQKEGNLKGTFALQRILVNFLLDRAQTSVPLPSRAVPR